MKFLYSEYSPTFQDVTKYRFLVIVPYIFIPVIYHSRLAFCNSVISFSICSLFSHCYAGTSLLTFPLLLKYLIHRIPLISSHYPCTSYSPLFSIPLFLHHYLSYSIAPPIIRLSLTCALFGTAAVFYHQFY